MSLQIDFSVIAIVLTPEWVLAVAGGGVNVPSVASDVLLGNRPPVATSMWWGDRFASTRVNELNPYDFRSSDCGSS